MTGPSSARLVCMTAVRMAAVAVLRSEKSNDRSIQMIMTNDCEYTTYGTSGNDKWVWNKKYVGARCVQFSILRRFISSQNYR